MNEIFTPDPEGDPQEEAELTQRLVEAVHWYENKLSYGKCEAVTYKFCYEHKISDTCNPCGLEKWSILHHNEDRYLDDEDY
jgi:hypothetical protein